MTEALGPESQRAFVAAAQGSAALAALIGSPVRFFDAVPEDAAYPYVAFGDFQQLPDKSDCIDGSESYVTLHVWSKAVGSVEAKRIAAALIALYDDADLAIAGQRLVSLTLESSRVFADPDGLTTHGVLTFRLITDPA